MQAALAGLNAEMEEAARSLGCRGLRLFRKVTLPSILPSVFAAGSIVFIWAFTELRMTTEVTGRPPIRPAVRLPTPWARSSRFGCDTRLYGSIRSVGWTSCTAT